MQSAETFLEVIKSRGERGLDLKRVYRSLRKRELFEIAYANLSAKTTTLLDHIAERRIDSIIEALAAGTYRWTPVALTNQLTESSWNDKLLQEVIRLVLSSYYEAQFSDFSHWARTNRGCHTALREIVFKWKGCKWFIQAGTRGCFDKIDPQKLLALIAQSIKDERFMKLLRDMLKTNVLSDWQYDRTFSGTPQGGVISPLLANIFLNQLDLYIEHELIPHYTRGERRKVNPEYAALSRAKRKAQKEGDHELYHSLVKEQRTLPYGQPFDPTYRRLKYVRYGDNTLIGFVGSRSEALEIEQKIRMFLSTIGLNSGEKSLITHATTEGVRFLGYNISMAKEDSRRSGKRRSINGTPILSVPDELVREWSRRRRRDGKPYHRIELIDHSDVEIVRIYQREFQSLVNYYTMAHNVASKLYPVKSIYLQSLVKTLAAKHKQKVPWVYQTYYRKEPNGINAIVVKEKREGQKPLVTKFGPKRIEFKKKVIIRDSKPK